MNILSLNVNGFGKGDFKLAWINNIIGTHKVAIVGIQETKRNKISDLMMRRLWGSLDFDFVFIESVGQGGGILTCWNKNLMEKNTVISRRDCLIVQGKDLNNGNPLSIVNVYASQDPKKREELWNFLSDYLNGWNGFAVVFGDFNDVRSERERRGSCLDERATTKFNEFIYNNNLFEVKMGGTDFTWIKGGGTKLSKLDRFLVIGSLDEDWKNIEVIADPRLFSDHKPLILKHVRRNYGVVPFKFFNSWMDEEECNQIIRDVWDNFSLEGNHLKIFIVVQKLKAIKQKLKVWSTRKKKEKVVVNLKCMDRLVKIDKSYEDGVDTKDIAKERLDIITKVIAIEKKENGDILQKNKNKWCLDGDENTALFHKTINKKKKRNGG